MVSKINFDLSEKIFEIDKENILFKINDSYINEITFNKSSNNIRLISVCEIFVKNLTSEYIIFRVQTSRKKYYLVNPSYCILNPNENKSIDISYYQGKEEVNPIGHKFKFEGFIIKEDEKDNSPKDIFFNYQNNHEKVKGTIIKKKVEFIKDNNYNIPKKFKKKEEEIYKNEEEKYHIEMSLDEEDLKHIEELENLKIEYYKLKNIIENLEMDYYNKKKILLLEQNKINDEFNHDNKKIYIITENKQNPISNFILITSFIISILVGFYLTK